MNLELENKHVLITGASGGIGTEITKLFLMEKANVTAQYNTRNSTLQTFLTDHPSSIHAVQADLRQEKDVEHLFTKANEKFGRVDVLIANAGVWPKEIVPIHKMSLERWNNTIATDLTGSFLCAKYFNQNLVKYPGEFGSIVLIGSTAGVFGEANHTDYSSAKAALKGFMLSVKNEIVHLAPKARINLVNPGWTVTPMAKGALEDKYSVKRILQTIPMRKVAGPDDIAHTIVFLSSEVTAGHITGQSVTIAGGMEGRVLFEREEIDI